MGVIKRHDATIWYIIFEHNGRRYKASSGTTDKTKARAIEAKMRTELLAGNDPNSLPKVTLAEAVSRYIDAVIKPKNNRKVLSGDSYLLGRVRRDLGVGWLPMRLPQKPFEKDVVQMAASVIDGHDQHLVGADFIEDAPGLLENLADAGDAVPLEFGNHPASLGHLRQGADAVLQPVENLVGVDGAVAGNGVGDGQDVVIGPVAVDDRPALHASAF
jgi:hypothetical protein